MIQYIMQKEINYKSGKERWMCLLWEIDLILGKILKNVWFLQRGEAKVVYFDTWHTVSRLFNELR